MRNASSGSSTAHNLGLMLSIGLVLFPAESAPGQGPRRNEGGSSKQVDGRGRDASGLRRRPDEVAETSLPATTAAAANSTVQEPAGGNADERISDPAARSGSENALDGVHMMPGVTFSVAVTNKGNWPKLERLPDGELLAAFYNHPSHGFGAGDIELWFSKDDGKSWQLRSQVSDHHDAPKSCRMNHATGRTSSGNLIVVVGGWSEGRNLPLLPVQICISDDDGRSWKRHETGFRRIPFGKVIEAQDGRLVCGMYDVNPRAPCVLYESKDQGKTWQPGPTLGETEVTSETAICRCRDGKWLAAARSAKASHLYLYSSNDDGRTWSAPRKAPLPGFPANLVELKNGAILLTASQRDQRNGITACFSSDGGETWEPFQTLISVPWSSDHGYPSSVQLDDETILTAYYWGGRWDEGKYGGRDDLPNNRGLPWHPDYHMGIARWKRTK